MSQKPVTHGSDLDAHEAFMASVVRSLAAHDLRLMLARFHVDGMLGKSLAVDVLTCLLGHPPRRYRDFAADLAETWK